VILDVMLPGIDGFAVADRTRKAGNFVPILMLTAKSLPSDVVHGLEAGPTTIWPSRSTCPSCWPA
jgi:two-component system OmpR family response regulator